MSFYSSFTCTYSVVTGKGIVGVDILLLFHSNQSYMKTTTNVESKVQCGSNAIYENIYNYGI